jgi:type II secretory pathway pseudopilin PulG
MTKTNSKSQSGRSMVEMLGVLAIIGVLSVGGIYGYTVAMRSNRVNEIAHGVSMLNTMGQALNNGQGDARLNYEDAFHELPDGVDQMVYDNHKIAVRMEDDEQDDCLFLTNKMGETVDIISPCALGQVTFQFKNSGSNGSNNGGSVSGGNNDSNIVRENPQGKSCTKDGDEVCYIPNGSSSGHKCRCSGGKFGCSTEPCSLSDLSGN